MAHNRALRALKLAAALLFTWSFALLPLPAFSVPICGPGSDWVNSCAPGQDSFLGTFNVSFEWLAPSMGPLLTGDVYDLSLYGPTTVSRSDPLGSGQIDTEIITAQGEQLHPTLGPLTLRIGTGNGVSLATTGKVTQTSSLLADSFFDVFFELDSLLGSPIYNLDPLHIASMDLRCLPPGEIDPTTGKPCTGSYRAELSPAVYLYSNSYFDGQQAIAQVVESTDGAPPHHDVPAPASLILVGLGLAGLQLSRRKRAR